MQFASTYTTNKFDIQPQPLIIGERLLAQALFVRVCGIFLVPRQALHAISSLKVLQIGIDIYLGHIYSLVCELP